MKLAAAALVMGLPLVASAGDAKDCKAGKGAACLRLGHAAKDDAAALPYFEQACAAKVAAGCGIAGSMYIHGQGTKVDLAKGFALRVKACDADDFGSCNDLGTAWSEGNEGAAAVDHARAKGLYEKACKGKDGLGCFNLGNVYRLGEGVKVDLQAAFDNFKKSCDLDQAKGCTEQAIMYYEGKPVPKDEQKAVELLGKACKLGSQPACKNLEILKQAAAGK